MKLSRVALAALAVAAAYLSSAPAADAGPYHKTVSVTSTATAVTPTPAPAAAVVIIQNDGPSALWFDTETTAVNDASIVTSVKLPPCEGRRISWPKGAEPATISVITAASTTTTARVTAYARLNDVPLPGYADVFPVAGCQTAGSASLLTANGASMSYVVNSESITLSTGGSTTDSSANLLPANSIIDAVVCRVTTTITTATDWKLSDTTTAGRFSAADSTMTAGETIVGLAASFGVVSTTAAGPTQAAAAKLRITTTGTPGAGVVRCSVFARTFVAPTS